MRFIIRLLCIIFLFSKTYSMEITEYLNLDYLSPDNQTSNSNISITQSGSITSGQDNTQKEFEPSLETLIDQRIEKFFTTIIKPYIDEQLAKINTSQSAAKDSDDDQGSANIVPTNKFIIKCNQCDKIFTGHDKEAASHNFRCHCTHAHPTPKIAELANRAIISRDNDIVTLMCQECKTVFSSRDNAAILKLNYQRHLGIIHKLLPSELQEYIDKNMMKPANMNNDALQIFDCPRCTNQIIKPNKHKLYDAVRYHMKTKHKLTDVAEYLDTIRLQKNSSKKRQHLSDDDDE